MGKASSERIFKSHFPNATIELQQTMGNRRYYLVRKKREGLPVSDGKTAAQTWKKACERCGLTALKKADPPPSVDELLAKVRRLDRVTGGYGIVDMDLVANGFTANHPGVAFLREQHARVHAEFERAKSALSDAQAKCEHAFARIGEAVPPFNRCVRCYATRGGEP